MWFGEFIRFYNASGNIVNDNIAVSTSESGADFEVKVEDASCFDNDSDDGFEPVCTDD